MAWRRKVRRTARPSGVESKPAAVSATCRIGVPSIHSTVSTRFAVRFQSTSGTRKPSSLFDVAGHLGDRRRLEPQIHLEFGRVLQVVDDRHRLQPPRRFVIPLDHAGREVVAVEVAAEALFDIRTQDFDGHRLLDAVVHHVGLVDLRDRRGGDGRSEFDEVIFELAAKRPLDRVARLGHREGVGLVLQMAQVGRQFRADDIGARCEKLSEFDVARPESRKGGATRVGGGSSARNGAAMKRIGTVAARAILSGSGGHALRNEADAMLR